jgi:hypothetical protein
MYFLILVLAVFGAIGLIQGEFKLSGYRKVRASAGRVAGLILLAGAALTYFYSSAFGLLALIVAAAIALTNLQEVHYPPPDDWSPPPG